MTSKKSSWKKFSALIPPTVLIFLDQTILPVALPSIQEKTYATDTAMHWCVNAYLLTIAIFVLVSGKLGDRLGHEKILKWGLLGFVGFSIACALSQTVEMLIAARAFQGVSAALMMPSRITIISLIFPKEKWGKATGMLISLSSLFLILGPLIGGYLIEIASWQWIFWINLPIGILGLWLIDLLLPASAPGKTKVDLLGFTFFALGISSLTLIFMNATHWGWSSNRTMIAAGLSMIALAAVLYREKTAPHPFLDLSLFKHPVYAAINISIPTIQFFIMINVFRTIYFQEILDYSPFQTGLILCISSSPTLFISPIAGYLSDRFNPKLPIALGYLSLIFSSFWLAFFSLPSLISLMIALFLFSTGIPLIFTPSYSSAIGAIPKSKIGAAAGAITTLRMTGGTVGLSLIYLFIASVQKHYLPIEGDRLAEIRSFSYVHFALSMMLMIAFSITFVLHPRKSSHHFPNSPAEGWD